MGKRVADMTPEEREKVRARSRARYEANCENKLEYARAYREANREKVKGEHTTTASELADLPARLSEAQKEAVRGAAECFNCAKCHALRDAFPEVFGDNIVTVTWKSGDPEEKLADLLRVARMEGAHAVAVVDGVTHSGSVEVRRDSFDYPYLAIGDAGVPRNVWFYDPGWTITVTAPKPADPTGGDPVVLARSSNPDYKRVYFLAEDGKWVTGRDYKFGVWTTENLIDVERLSAETIAELMGGAS